MADEDPYEDTLPEVKDMTTLGLLDELATFYPGLEDQEAFIELTRRIKSSGAANA